VEQDKPYLVWICLSVHNRSHSMEHHLPGKVLVGRARLAGTPGGIWRHDPIRHRFRLVNAGAWPTDVSLIAQTFNCGPSTLCSASSPEGVMTSHSRDLPSVLDICEHVKHLGYAISRRIRLYGEEFEVVSDPFPEADGIAVHVTTKNDSSIRVLRIPATVLQSAKGRRRH